MIRWIDYLVYGLAGGFDPDCAAEATSFDDHLVLIYIYISSSI